MCMEFPSSLEPILEATLIEDEEVYKTIKTDGINDAGMLLDIRANSDVDQFVGKEYWHAFLVQLHTLICTNDEVYKEERKKIEQVKSVGDKAIIPIIAGVIGAQIGLAGSMLVPFVALALFALIKVGTKAWCSSTKDDLGKSLESKKKAPAKR